MVRMSGIGQSTFFIISLPLGSEAAISGTIWRIRLHEGGSALNMRRGMASCFDPFQGAGTAPHQSSSTGDIYETIRKTFL